MPKTRRRKKIKIAFITLRRKGQIALDIITAIIQNPSASLTIVSVALAFFFAWLLYGSFKDRIKSFEGAVNTSAIQVQVAQSSFEEKMQQTRSQLQKHSEDMGKMTKAVQGDFLKIQEKIFDLRQELVLEVEKVKTLSGDTTRALTLAHEITKLSIDGLNEKLGRIILIEKDINVFKVQIEKVQESVGQNKLEVVKNTSQVGALTKLLQDTREKFRTLETEIKKGSKNEIQ